jgi:predicted site-specific integrase-resolvase
LGCTTQSLIRWDNAGILKAYRRPTGRRFYPEEQYLKYMDKVPSEQLKGETVIYYRVSSDAQRDDLKSQLTALELFCTQKGWEINDRYTDIGSGLNYNRPDLLKLSKEIITRKIKRLVIDHKDILVRFGFEWWEHLCSEYGVELVVMNQERLSPEAEMVQDLLSIIHVFSSRLYGLRKYKKPIKKDLG